MHINKIIASFLYVYLFSLNVTSSVHLVANVVTPPPSPSTYYWFCIICKPRLKCSLARVTCYIEYFIVELFIVNTQHLSLCCVRYISISRYCSINQSIPVPFKCCRFFNVNLTHNIPDLYME